MTLNYPQTKAVAMGTILSIWRETVGCAATRREETRAVTPTKPAAHDRLLCEFYGLWGWVHAELGAGSGPCGEVGFTTLQTMQIKFHLAKDVLAIGE